MRDIRTKTLGEIMAGEDTGRFIEVLDDSHVSGGFLILIFDNVDRSGEAHDHWVESIVDVEMFFDELGWVVRWLGDPSTEGESLCESD